jgi:cytochrome c peroxidase
MRFVLQRNRSIRVLLICFLSMIVDRAPTAEQSRTIFGGVLPLGVPTPGPASEGLAAITLGQYLFNSVKLSRTQTISCASCHHPSLGFSGDVPQAIGAAGYRTNRHAPPLANLYISHFFMTDGRANDLARQHALPLESPEMAVDWPSACAALERDSQSAGLRRKAGVLAFTRDSVIRLLAAFVGSLVSGGSRFDQFYYGGKADALNVSEQNGLRIFVQKGRCATCHLLDGRAAPLTDGSFHATGVGFVDGAYQDHGRSTVTHISADDGAFKTPSLRNAGLRPFFMHDGSFHSLEDVVGFYNRGGTPGARNLDPRLQPLYLSGPESRDLVAFLRSLTAPVTVFEPADTPARGGAAH